MHEANFQSSRLKEVGEDKTREMESRKGNRREKCATRGVKRRGERREQDGVSAERRCVGIISAEAS